jgi:hypothetical protein
VSLGHTLAKKARVLQLFDVTWDVPQAWHRWREIFHDQLFYRMHRLQIVFVEGVCGSAAQELPDHDQASAQRFSLWLKPRSSTNSDFVTEMARREQREL